MRYKVALFGRNKSGKSQLAQRIATNTFNLEESSLIVAVNFLSRKIDSNNSIDLWDITGDKLFNPLYQFFYKGSDVGVFCIDLTEPINEQEFIENIKIFRQFAPYAPIICVGTKLDSPKADRNALEKIKAKELFAGFITTSAKEGDNVDELFSMVSKLCEGKLISQWERAVAKLKGSLKELPQEKSTLIDNELGILSKVILTNPKDRRVTPREKAKAIEDFTHNCEVLLKGEHSNVFKAVLSVAAAAIVLTVTALIGFAIGVACSWWTGPGAFFAGILSGYTAAVAVASSSTGLGVIAGGITAFGLFKTTKEMNAINAFTAEVSSFDKAIVL